MARKKVKLAWIANDSTRRATFKKRKKGLMKKASELATLCDVKACVVVYGPQETQPEVWPSVREAARVLTRFKSLPEMEQCKKMVNQEGFLRQRMAKMQEQLRKQERDNRELDTTLLMYRCLAGKNLHEVSIEAVTSLGWMVEMKAKSVRERIDRMQTELAAASAAAVAAAAAQGVGSQAGGREKYPMEVTMEAFQRQNWMMEVMNQNENLVFGEDMLPAYIDHNSPWLDPYFFSV